LHVPGLGVYAGPGPDGVRKAAAFGTTTGVPLTHVLDFASAKNWAGITGPDWLIDPHRKEAERLEYSLPMMPEGDQYSLHACAAGDYDVHWQTLARNLAAAGLRDVIVRPGWEFNGDWYSWSAAGHEADYVGCFRRIVTAMRTVDPTRFSFDWNPTLGRNAMPAEKAYPGDAYVDYVGVDAYDASPVFVHSHDKDATAKAWQQIARGDHGLMFWSRFAAAHHKPMAVPEWGVVGGAQGQGGGDDPSYIDHMFKFMTDPDHHVAYEQYFDAGSSFAQHSIGAGTQFPHARARFLAWMRKLS
jgi:hypothetical protein